MQHHPLASRHDGQPFLHLAKRVSAVLLGLRVARSLAGLARQSQSDLRRYAPFQGRSLPST
jgi:hypothetical protein